MNERTQPPQEAPVPRTAPRHTQGSVTGRDREFLPAALEILETPSPPLPIALMMAICFFFAAALTWSFVGKLDVHAVAQGKIERAGRAKVIEPLDPGKIAAIHIAPGDHVKTGDVLLELDPAEAKADVVAESDALDSAVAEVARRRAEINIAQSIQRRFTVGLGTAGENSVHLSVDEIAANPNQHIEWDRPTPPAVRLRQNTVMIADLYQLADGLDDLDKQMAQKDATRKRLEMSIDFQGSLIQTLMDRVHTRQEAIQLAVGTKINLFDAKESLQKSQAALASDQGQLIETAAALRELGSQKIKTVSQFIDDNENKLVDAARKADEAREALAKANARLGRTKLVAPIDGIVQQISVTTIGQVVTTGQELAVVTPTDGQFQVEALVANLDIGFVKLGQDVAIKVDAFPYTRFGVVHGKVVSIASQAVDEQEAKRSLADATAASSPVMSPSGGAPGQPSVFVFPVTISLDSETMNIDGAAVPLVPGMTVTAEIKTDQRRVIDYLFSPLAKVGSDALHER